MYRMVNVIIVMYRMLQTLEYQDLHRYEGQEMMDILLKVRRKRLHFASKFDFLDPPFSHSRLGSIEWCVVIVERSLIKISHMMSRQIKGYSSLRQT